MESIMNSFDPTTEQRLATDIKTVIKYANEGMHPDEAITKVAEEREYNPTLIQTVCGVFNKSKTVSYLEKVSADKRAANFAIADPYKIIKKIYGQEKAAESTATIPDGDFTDLDFEEPLDKAAEAVGEGQGQGEEPRGTGGTSYCFCPKCGYTKEHSRNTPCNQEKCPECDVPLTGVAPDKEAGDLSFDAVKVKVDKYTGMYKRAVDEYDTRIKFHTQKLQDCINKIAECMKRQPTDKMQKTAQLTVNGYPSFGHKMLELIQSRISQTIPKVEKTAYAAVFPSGEPFLTMTELCDHAYKLRDLKLAKQAFEKNAGVEENVGKFLRWVTDNTVPTGDRHKGDSRPMSVARMGGNWIRPGLEAATVGKYTNPNAGRLKQFLGSDVENTLKEVNAKKNFILLSLYDKHLNKYDMGDLANAYNDAVAANPQSYDNPSVLKPAMLRYLETGGYIDVPQRQQELQMGELAEKSKRLAEADTTKKRQDMETSIDTLFPTREVPKMEEPEKSPANKRRKSVAEKNKGQRILTQAEKALQEGDPDLAARYMDSLKSKHPDVNSTRDARQLQEVIRAEQKRQEDLEDQEDQEDQTKDTEQTEQERQAVDIDIYTKSLRDAVRQKDTDKAEDILEELVEKYPDYDKEPHMREVIRDLNRLYEK